MLCPIHNQEFKLIPAGTSKTTGKPYSAFWACPERGCRAKPNQPVNDVQYVPGGSTPAAINHQAKTYFTGSDKMTKEDWEAKENRKNNFIMLGMAFKAAVEMSCHGKITIGEIYEKTENMHKWLLSQTTGEKPATGQFNPSGKVVDLAPELYRPIATSDDLEAGNRAISEAQADMVDGIDF